MAELFSAFGVDWKLLLAQALNFGIVLILLWYFLYRPVLATLERRCAFIAKGVEDAKRAEQLFSRADEEAASRIAVAETEAEGIVARGREATIAEKATMLEEAHLRAERMQQDAAARAAEESARASRENEREIARLALLAAEKVMTQKT